MTDSLADRIAQVIHAALLKCGDGYVDSYDIDLDCVTVDVRVSLRDVAAAIVAELGLREESPQLCAGGSNRHRYVTEWTADE